MDHRLICKYRDLNPLINKKYNELLEIDCFGIKTSYSIANDGAGTLFKEGFIKTLQNLFPNRKFNKCFEWCSGPGFLGYSTLGAGIADKLVLGDVHESALLEAKITAIKNNIEHKVNFYHSNNWDDIPLSEQFDLIIGDPPMYRYVHYQHEYFNYDKRLYLDEDWLIHKNFFKNVGKYLVDDGSIVIVENIYGSGLNTFADMIENSGLKIVDHFYQDKNPNSFLWYMHIKKL